MKICKKCGIEKELDCFGKGKGECKACACEQSKKYYLNNKEKRCQYAKNYRENNKEKLSKQNKQYCINNKDKIAEYLKQNKDKISECKKAHYIANKEKILEHIKLNAKKRRKIDPAFRLRHYVSGSILYALKRSGSSKCGASCMKYLPYTIQELEQHLESQFEPWMNWNNRGNYRLNEWDDNDPLTWRWQLDHIIPHSTFNYISMDSQEFRDCWALSNLRPLSAKQNVIEGASRTRH